VSAIEYNQERLDDGRISGDDIVQLVRFWQEGHGLKVDGYCGPNTLATIRPEAGRPAGVSDLAYEALRVAVDNLGQGEVGGNNSGPFVEMLHGKKYDGDSDDDGAWCAAFMSFCFESAADGLGVELPFLRSGGAKRLYRNASNAGRSVEPSVPGFENSAQPGDLVCWHRGDPTGWQGHIGIVERVEGSTFHTIEGNVGRYPSKVRRFRHSIDDPRLIGFARV
jgi:hypothetical protein